MTEKSKTATGHRDAVDAVRNARGFAVTLPVVGRVKVPHPEQVAYYGALGILAAVEIIDWPVALLLGAGHVLMQNEHNRVVQEVGEALADA
ncbi:hypothetical protein [Mycolicibacterium conceptionense]|uniref:Uncharacterized protein n=1 Tax=Mycolicibacterium conceptionense TaxID=451644 RepID=A0A0U1CZW6_9MYCO|nr:hypothetical protein [Mycolicibacterium conceptionense]OMB86973.1 hypothetical protein A5743_24925 [Mycolicibacterium conceptionense]ORV27374.1 hypothetical protein AWB98_10680 [Mycolicibacterium conceptionense]CQD03702.1 hypothetical protein BN970_00533 [Mycolicibacterium conceptionense]